MFFLVQSSKVFLMTSVEKHYYLDRAKNLSRFFRVTVKIEIFGHVIWEFSYPPKSK